MTTQDGTTQDGATQDGATQDGPLRIGLLNNMPREALRATERQVAGLLAAAGAPVSLRCFTLAPPRAVERRQPLARYEGLDRLLDSELDGLIVTGAAPVAASIQDEPGWPGLARVVDWAARHTVSTLWSCLAAQAAVFRLDGVPRRRLATKLSGVFACEASGEHPLLAGMPRRWSVPHSRTNDLDPGRLAACGYAILSQGPRVGADVFARRVGRSHFVFLQGHPEYAPDSLYREYRRDVRLFLRGERAVHPTLPEGYLTAEVAAALAALRRRAELGRDLALLPLLDAATAGGFGHAWHPPAVQLYRRWLATIAAAARNQEPQFGQSLPVSPARATAALR